MTGGWGARDAAARSPSQPVVPHIAYFSPEEYAQAWARDLLDAANYRDHGDRPVWRRVRHMYAFNTGEHTIVDPRSPAGIPAGGERLGYQKLLQTLADPADPEHDDAVDWLGEGFDPTRFRDQASTEPGSRRSL